MLYKQISLPVLTNDANGICEDQTTAAAGALTLDGALVSGGVATAAAAQIIAIEGTGDNSGITFTITGTCADGHSRTEVVTGANNGTAKTTNYFKTVTGIVASGAVTGNVEIGWLAADGMATATVPLNIRQEDFLVTVGFNELVDGMTASAQYSLDNPFDSTKTPFQDNAQWVEVTNMSGVTADATTTIAFPVRAIRFIESTGTATATATCTLIQAE